MGGDAWVLPVNQLSEAEDARVRDQVNRERQAEYAEVTQEAATLLVRAGSPPSNREVGALRRRLDRIRGRDHYGAKGRDEAGRAVDELVKQSLRSQQAVALAAD